MFGLNDDFINEFLLNIKQGIQLEMSIRELYEELEIIKTEKWYINF